MADGHSSRLTALVTGAAGSVGPALVRHLAGQGYQVRVLARSQPQPGLLPDSVRIVQGDLSERQALQEAATHVDIVFHLAALLHLVNPPPALREQYEQVNVGGTANVVEAALQTGVKRLVFYSTIAVYGASAAGQILSEATPPCPATFYAQTKLAAEQLVLQARRQDGQPLGTVLRLGAIYGPRVKGNYRRLAQALARGRFVSIGHGNNRRTLVYDGDVARAAVLAASHPAATGQIYNVSDGQLHTLNDIIAAMCEALGRTPPRFSLPAGPARFAAGILEDVAQLAGRRSPIGRATLDKYVEDVAVSSQRIQAELGFVPKFDLRTGWQETIQTMRQSGDL